MIKPIMKQTQENFEECLKGRELILYGKSKVVCDLVKQYNVKYIVDQNDELWDTNVQGVDVCSPNRLYQENIESVIILVCVDGCHVYDITKTIQAIDHFIIFYWDVLQSPFLREISSNLFDYYERIRNIEIKLYDDYSKKVLREVVHRRMIGAKNSFNDLKVQNEVQYLFYSAIESKHEGAILDCGAYIGDTVDRFVHFFGNSLNKIYSFEAFSENINKIYQKKKEISQYWDGQLEIVPYAVSNEKKMIQLIETEKKGGCYSPEFRGITKFKYEKPINIYDIETCTIDDIIPEHEKVRYIKMDIEGAEFEALQGAEQTIKREKPGLAISIYHNAEDYFRLAELILEFVPEYNIAIRHHKAQHVDTVLYAWI